MWKRRFSANPFPHFSRNDPYKSLTRRRRSPTYCPSPDVAPIHPDATPVLLLTEDEREMWVNAPVEMALSLQRLPPAGALRVVATDTK